MTRRARKRTGSRIVGAMIAAALTLGGAVVAVQALATPDTPVVPVECTDGVPAADAFVAGFGGERLRNATTVMRAGADLGLSRDAQRLGVMAAMGESGLRNIDYGDWETSGRRNPDGTPTSSIGLFQQQEWWGSVEERMDPYAAATKFYTRLVQMHGWQHMPPSHAIHRVQINDDENHYDRWQQASMDVVEALIAGGCLDR